MTISDSSHDPSIFPDSTAFIPERWLGDPRTPDGLPLDRFMVSFGRGTRACLGVTLAWTEMYLVLGMMFRRFKYELFESSVKEVEVGHDFFIPITSLESKGLRVFVKSVD